MMSNIDWETLARDRHYQIKELDKISAEKGGELARLRADNAELVEALRAQIPLMDWLSDEAENLTCSDLCDKTHEQQGCPSGTCALTTGREQIRKAQAETQKVLAKHAKREG